jgi:hypothetical protein
MLAQPPQGVIGLGEVARRLLAAIASRPQSDRQTLMATANDDLLVLTGATDALPWIDGAGFIAPRPEAQALWMPTAQRPDLPLDLLEQAIRRHHSQSPLLLLPAPARLVPLTRLLPLDEGLLTQIRSRWGLG